MLLFPNAKINIGLDILYKRDDGFHELETLMYPIKLNDILTINVANDRPKGLKLTTTGLIIDGSLEDNIIYKTYNLLSLRFNLPAIDIHLHKSIPFGAGLGGGSSDGAFALFGINELCNLNLTINVLEDIATQLGSDCPFFIKNSPAVAKGRGEKLSGFESDLSHFSIALVVPPIPISTISAYSRIKPFVPEKGLEERLALGIENWREIVPNNFEDSVFTQYPEIKLIKEKLYNAGAIYASLSGSGSAVFGIFKQKPELHNIFPKNYFIWI